jgi:hypothetical protein
MVFFLSFLAERCPEWSIVLQVVKTGHGIRGFFSTEIRLEQIPEF